MPSKLLILTRKILFLVVAKHTLSLQRTIIQA